MALQGLGAGAGHHFRSGWLDTLAVGADGVIVTLEWLRILADLAAGQSPPWSRDI